MNRNGSYLFTDLNIVLWKFYEKICKFAMQIRIILMGDYITSAIRPEWNIFLLKVMGRLFSSKKNKHICVPSCRINFRSWQLLCHDLGSYSMQLTEKLTSSENNKVVFLNRSRMKHNSCDIQLLYSINTYSENQPIYILQNYIIWENYK